MGIFMILLKIIGTIVLLGFIGMCVWEMLKHTFGRR